MQISLEEVSISELEKQIYLPSPCKCNYKRILQTWSVWFQGYEASPLSWSSMETVCRLKNCGSVDLHFS